MSEPPPDRAAGWLNAIKGLSAGNILALAAVAVIAVPVYIVWKAVGDPESGLMDRLMSTYEEIPQSSGCTLRHVQERGGPDLYSVSSGFAFQGADRWFVSVVVPHEPSVEEIDSYCASLKLISDAMLDRGRDPEIHGGPVPGAEADRGGHDRPVPADAAEEAE
jgi:hypothetical protein